ncbi:response regulator [Paenibacillus sp. WQ 127069]|uniref:Response regulator n=1 Tax=Paenibacillus baimaensis TaxID=2982185 RepID=A0ABT2UDJ4_9BACL|nr:response regulator [Paenibacillus sp. WQ 127069]MCU6792056.1 response regulator [Paenibacillus sp. WQ 127069]
MATIFVVDDEPIIGIGLKALIGEYKRFHDIQTFTDSVKALSQMVSNPPDVLLTDIRMPRMDGLELCRQIQLHKLSTQIVVLSGHGDFAYAQKSMSYGAKEYLLKPITEIELFPVLDKLLAEREAPIFSYADLERWIDQLEESIWMLDRLRVQELLSQGKDELLAGVTGAHLRQRVFDGMMLLARKLNARGVYRFETESLMAANAEHTLTYERFQTEIAVWLQQLGAQRNHETINVLEAALCYIDANLFDENLTLDRVAERLGITPTYFSHYFKKKTNETFVQYRLRKRMEKAKQLLAVPHHKIIDIVGEIGYDSYPHFSRSFKKSTGYSPTEYRALLGIQ